MTNPFATFIAFLSLCTATLRYRAAGAAYDRSGIEALMGERALSDRLYLDGARLQATARWAEQDYAQAECWAGHCLGCGEHLGWVDAYCGPCGLAKMAADFGTCGCGSTDTHPELGQCAACLDAEYDAVDELCRANDAADRASNCDSTEWTQCDYCRCVVREERACTDAWGHTACYPGCERPIEAPATPIDYVDGIPMPACVAEYVLVELADWTPPTYPQDWSEWSY